jgi:acid phosphatase type 7
MPRTRSTRTRRPGAATPRALALLAALVAAAAGAATRLAAADAATSPQTFSAPADTYVSSQNPTTVHGSLAYLKTGASPERRIYVRFDPENLGGAVTNATLRLFTQTTTTSTVQVHGVPDTAWSEASTTFANAPAYAESQTGLPGPYTSTSPISSGAWLSIDVTPLVRGAGPVGFAVTSASSSSIQFASREAGASTAPQLVVETTPVTGPPVALAPPTVSGQAVQGQTLAADPGTWGGDQPIDFSYQWRRCDASGGACLDVAGAGSQSYTLTEADVGAAMRVTVTAVNASGTGTASSAATAPVKSATAVDRVVMAAGDIACGTKSTGARCKQFATSDLLLAGAPDAVLPLGDVQYECGGLADFQRFYDPSWGRLRSVTHPAVGNHEYSTSTDAASNCYQAPAGAAGYYQYFGAAGTPLEPACTASCKGYYSFDVGAWHLIAINSNCTKVGGCSANSPMEKWLRQDLAATGAACVLAYWHHPRFTSGKLASEGTKMNDIWNDLVNAHADVVLAGHDHDYERFTTLGAASSTTLQPTPSATGVREFVVGTGGRNNTSFSTPRTGSEVRDSSTFGVLELDLHAAGYDWKFRPIAGQTFTDQGSAACH